MKPAVIIKVFGIFMVVVVGIGVVGLVMSLVRDLGEQRPLVLGFSVAVLGCGVLAGLLRSRVIRKSREVAAVTYAAEAAREASVVPVDETEFAVLVERIRDCFAGKPYFVEQTGPHSITVLTDPADPSVRSKLSDEGLDTVAGVEVTAREGHVAVVEPFRQKVEFADGVARVTGARELGGSTYTKTVTKKHDVGHADVDTQMVYTDDTDLVTPVFDVLRAENWRPRFNSPIPDLTKLLPHASMLIPVVQGLFLAIFTVSFIILLTVFLLI